MRRSGFRDRHFSELGTMSRLVGPNVLAEADMRETLAPSDDGAGRWWHEVATPAAARQRAEAAAGDAVRNGAPACPCTTGIGRRAPAKLVPS